MPNPTLVPARLSPSAPPDTQYYGGENHTHLYKDPDGHSNIAYSGNSLTPDDYLSR